MEIDLGNTCRICLSNNEQMHHIFSEFDQGIILQDILKSTTNFEVTENDGLPPYLCQNCTTIVVDFFNLKTIYKENEAQIRAILSGANPQGNKMEETQTTSDNNELINQETNNSAAATNNTIIKLETVTDNNSVGGASDDLVDKKEAALTENEQTIDIENDLKSNEDKNIVLQFQELRNYTCPICGDCFLHKHGIKKHMSFKHQKNISNCDQYCTVTHIKLQQIYDEDVEGGEEDEEEEDEKPLTLTSTSPNTCPVCSLVCENEATRREHLETHKRHVCEICGLNFLKKSYLKDHKEIHIQEKRHVCEYCHKAFQRRTVLVKHRRIHTHPRECICEICGKAFNDKGTLKTHIMLLHVKSRNYVCMICGVRFPLKATLEKHIRRHTEKTRDFHCTECTSAYKDKSSLDRHVLIKHSGANVKSRCFDCGREYTTNGNLQKHRRICKLRFRAGSGANVEVKEEVVCLNFDELDS